MMKIVKGICALPLIAVLTVGCSKGAPLDKIGVGGEVMVSEAVVEDLYIDYLFGQVSILGTIYDMPVLLSKLEEDGWNIVADVEQLGIDPADNPESIEMEKTIDDRVVRLKGTAKNMEEGAMPLASCRLSSIRLSEYGAKEIGESILFPGDIYVGMDEELLLKAWENLPYQTRGGMDAGMYLLTRVQGEKGYEVCVKDGIICQINAEFNYSAGEWKVEEGLRTLQREQKRGEKSKGKRERQEPLTLSDNLDQIELEYEGDVIRLPVAVSELNDYGFVGLGENGILKANEQRPVMFYSINKGNIITTVVNPSSKEQTIKDSIVIAMEVGGSGEVFTGLKVGLPKGIWLYTSTREDVLAAYGEPQSVVDSEHVYIIEYAMEKGAYERWIRIQFDDNREKVTNVDLKNNRY